MCVCVFSLEIKDERSAPNRQQIKYLCVFSGPNKVHGPWQLQTIDEIGSAEQADILYRVYKKQPTTFLVVEVNKQKTITTSSK